VKGGIDVVQWRQHVKGRTMAINCKIQGIRKISCKIQNHAMKAKSLMETGDMENGDR